MRDSLGPENSVESWGMKKRTSEDLEGDSYQSKAE